MYLISKQIHYKVQTLPDQAENLHQVWNNYVKPMSYFRNITFPQNIRRIELMSAISTGDFRDPYRQTKSMRHPERNCEYLNAIAHHFRRKGFEVTFRMGNSPDTDINYAASASVFVGTGGTFSQLLFSLNKYRTALRKKATQQQPAIPQDLLRHIRREGDGLLIQTHD